MFDLDTTLAQYFRTLSNPGFGRRHFEQMALRATPTLQDFLAQQAANGGSHVIAQNRFDFARRQAMDDAQQAFANFSLNRMGQVQTLLDLMSGRDQFRTNLDFQASQAALDREFQADQAALNRDFQATQARLDREFSFDQARRDRRTSFINNVIGTVGGIVAGRLGG